MRHLCFQTMLLHGWKKQIHLQIRFGGGSICTHAFAILDLSLGHCSGVPKAASLREKKRLRCPGFGGLTAVGSLGELS